MPVNNRIEGHLQYPTQAEGEAAQAWVTDWIANSPYVHGSVLNELTTVIDPPTDEGCTIQLNVVVHLSCPDADAMEMCHAEWMAAVYGGGVAEAQCNSNLGGYGE